MADRVTAYAFGMLKSAKLEVFKPENQAETHTTTLEFHSRITTWVHRKTIGSNGVQPHSHHSNVRSFIVPLHALESSEQCEEWIKSKLLALRLVVVDSEIGDVKELLVGLVWKLRERVEAGERCYGVVEMDVARVVETLMEFRRRVVDKWIKVSEKRIEGENQSRTCAICLGEIEESSAVVKLICSHDFHSKCIGDWLIRKTNCPCCRRQVYIKFTFKIPNTNSIQFKLSAIVGPS